MTEWWPMLLFLATLFIGTMTVLCCGFVSIRDTRAHEAEQREELGSGIPRLSSFFVAPDSGTGAGPVEPPRSSPEVALQNYIVSEERAVADFAQRPSLESLYRTPERPIASRDLKRHLERELRCAARFVAEPSVESLYRRSERPAWIAWEIDVERADPSVPTPARVGEEANGSDSS